MSLLQDVQSVQIAKDFSIGSAQGNFTLIAGPCAIENRQMAVDTAGELQRICKELGLNFIFKASFDKANRSSVYAERGVGVEKGLEILQDIKKSLSLPVTTDVHEAWQCEPVGQVVDVIQIPAFLARQTDLLVAAAATGKVVNVKKAQFMSPSDMKNVVCKLNESKAAGILLCERGSTFGYNRLVVDMAGLAEMRALGYPVVFDATHSVQIPGGQGTYTGGKREMVAPLMRAALAMGVDAVFAEVHPDPDKAISDAANQIALKDIKEILRTAIAVDNIIRQKT
ncbi:MAG: 3-deoxy-8-phosphooctulonate synthase [Bacteroidales bacterium]